MRWGRLIAGVTSLSVAASALVYAGPTLLAASRFAARSAGLDPLTAVAVVRATAAGEVISDLEAAVAADDVELADSLLALADARDIRVPPALRAEVADLHGTVATTLRTAGDFGAGAWSGEADSLAGFAGMATADLLVIGDIRDIAGETATWWQGGEPDWLILGIATVGVGLSAVALGATASTPVTGGATVPVAAETVAARGGLSVIKVALKAPRALGRAAGAAADARGLRGIVAPLVREAVDPAVLKRAAAAFDVTEPKAAMAIARDAVDWRRVNRLTGVAADFERVRSAAGLRTALWLGRTVDGPADLARGTRRFEALGAKSLAVATRLGERAVKGVVRLIGFVWDLAAAVLGAVVGALHALTATLQAAWRLRRAFG